MFDTVKKCRALLPSRFRWGIGGLFLLMNLHALAQLLLVASFFPFLDAISASGDSGKGWIGFASGWLPEMGETAWFGILGLFVLTAVLLANFLGAVHGIAVARFSSAINANLSNRLLRGYLMRPYSYHLNRNSSEYLRNIFSEIDLVTDGFLACVMSACARILTICGIGTLLLIVNPLIALAAGGFFGGSYAVVYFVVRRRLEKAAEERAVSDDARYQAATEAFSTIKELKVLGRELHFLDAFEEPSRRYFRNLEKAQIFSELPRHLVETIAFAGMIGVALLLLQREGAGEALPVLGVFAIAGYRLLPAIKGLYSDISNLRYFRGSLETIYEACGEEEEEEDFESDSSKRLSFRKTIEFCNVSFRYPGSERDVLKKINLTFPARARIGLCGKSGAGKTTLADLVLGLFEPTLGEIRIDGVPLSKKNRRSWQLNCGYVPQQICLIDGTIRSNIAFGIASAEIDDRKVLAAANLANLHGFVESELPEKYETKVGEGGVRLSGGQRQRIGIARALYHDPEVIVLDEATSSLDPETEQAIVEALRSLAGRKTVIMIAHRHSTIRESDLLIHVSEGRTAELSEI